MPSPHLPQHKARQMLQPLLRKRPRVRPGPFSSTLSAHEGPQHTGALVAAGAARAGACPGVALRAALAHEMAATPARVHPGLCGQQGCSAATAGAAGLLGSLPRCPHAESRAHPWASLCQWSGVLRHPPLVPCACRCSTALLCARRHVLGPKAPHAPLLPPRPLSQRAGSKETCCWEGLPGSSHSSRHCSSQSHMAQGTTSSSTIPSGFPPRSNLSGDQGQHSVSPPSALTDIQSESCVLLNGSAGGVGTAAVVAQAPFFLWVLHAP